MLTGTEAARRACHRDIPNEYRYLISQLMSYRHVQWSAPPAPVVAGRARRSAIVKTTIHGRIHCAENADWRVDRGD